MNINIETVRKVLVSFLFWPFMMLISIIMFPFIKFQLWFYSKTMEKVLNQEIDFKKEEFRHVMPNVVWGLYRDGHTDKSIEIGNFLIKKKGYEKDQTVHCVLLLHEFKSGNKTKAKKHLLKVVKTSYFTPYHPLGKILPNIICEELNSSINHYLKKSLDEYEEYNFLGKSIYRKNKEDIENTMMAITESKK